MKTSELKRAFINTFYDGNYKEYLKAREADYCKVQFEWSYWVDLLCKDGEITQKQYDRAIF